MMMNENCPCKKKKCIRRGKCDECRKHHAKSKTRMPVYCERENRQDLPNVSPSKPPEMAREQFISAFSKAYSVRELKKSDIQKIFLLCKENALYYQYCPPFVTEENILDDMCALPPGKTGADKFYIGYFDGEKLIAVMDFIRNYPEESTALIGFFMTDKSVQNIGTGSRIIAELCRFLSNAGFLRVRLAWVKGNPQAEHFWRKNGFEVTGTTHDTNGHTVVSAEKNLWLDFA